MTIQMITCREMTDSEIQNGMFHTFEPKVHDLMKTICRDYGGGQWKFYVLSNESWFMAPAGKSRFTLQDTFGQDYDMSAEGAGLAAMNCLLGLLSSALYEQGRAEQGNFAMAHYYALLSYAYQGKDAEAIRAVLD